MISICQFRFGLPSLKPCSGKWYRPWVPDSSWLIQIVPIHTTNMDPGWFLKALLHGKESPQKTTPLPICRANTPSSCSHRWCQPARIGQLCGAHVDSWLCSPDPTRYLIKTVLSFMASWFSLSTPSKGFLKLSGSFCCIAPDSMTFFETIPSLMASWRSFSIPEFFFETVWYFCYHVQHCPWSNHVSVLKRFLSFMSISISNTKSNQNKCWSAAFSDALGQDVFALTR